MRFVSLIKLVLFSMIAMLPGTGLVIAAEIDDAAVFVEAFNAFRKKDYLLALEKADQLNQVFPDSPLRDVTILLIARSSMKSGDNELAAKNINRFRSEFSDSSLISTIEEELLALGARYQKGEQLQPNGQLQAAARKIRDERLAAERAALLRLEQEKLARERAEQQRIALEKAEAEQRELERLAAEKIAKDNIKTVISVPDSGTLVAAGQNGSIPVEITNSGKSSEEFLLEVSGAANYGVFMAAANKRDETVTRVGLAAGETFKGELFLRMPAEKVDGHRATITIKTVSSKYRDVINSKNTVVIASAPLVRVVARLIRPKVAPGEQLRYRITVLNLGSLPAEDLAVKVQLPPQLVFVGAPGLKFKKGQNGALLFGVDRIESGKLADINLDVKIRKSLDIGQEMRSKIEIVNNRLKSRNIFTASTPVVEVK